jgi:alkyldihydroxyacetonephosphate synthase
VRWWGWGEDGHQVAMPEAATALLREEVGADPGIARRRPVALEEVRLPAPRLADAARERLAAAVGAEHVRDDRELGARTRTSSGCARVTGRAPRTPCSCPDRPNRCAPCS